MRVTRAGLVVGGGGRRACQTLFATAAREAPAIVRCDARLRLHNGFDWNQWRLTPKLLPSGLAVALVNDTTGARYLWTNVTYDAAPGRLAFTQYLLSAAWPAASDRATWQLTDVNADNVPDVWAVSQAGDVTSYVVSNLSPTAPATIKAQPPQHLPS